MYRHHPQTSRARELVADGAIGELRVLRASFGFTLSERDRNVRLSADLAGGALMDVGCYCVSGTRLFAGEPEIAIGRQVVGPSGVDVRFAGTLVFAGDLLAHFDCGFDVPENSLLEVVGSEGTLRLPTAVPDRRAGDRAAARRRCGAHRGPGADSYRLEFEDVSAAIRGAGEPLLGRDDAVGQARAIEALYRSADRGGEPVACKVGDG